MSASQTGTRTWTITMPAGLELLTMNDRVHWSVRYRRSQQLRQAATWLARKERIPHLDKVFITAVYEPPDKRRRDPSNWHPSVKAIVDGLVETGVLDDDDAEHVKGPVIDIGPVHPLGRIVLHVAEVTADG